MKTATAMILSISTMALALTTLVQWITIRKLESSVKKLRDDVDSIDFTVCYMNQKGNKDA
jgi:heme-binding NEAT domain protein